MFAEGYEPQDYFYRVATTTIAPTPIRTITLTVVPRINYGAIIIIAIGLLLFIYWFARKIKKAGDDR